MRNITIFVALVGAVALPAAATGTKHASWEGTWHLNKTETHYPAGVMVTANDITVSKDDGKALKFSETVTSAGQTTTQNYDGAYDGKFYDVGDGESLAYTHVSANASKAVRHNKDGFVLERTTQVLSKDGKKLVCHVWAQRPGGKPIKFDEIFDRAQ
ncbi:MAG TPA: hypothetical protein VKZ79_18580 [Alphaproteobacteria bacterium]|nr:hypothetical protein [Alphaproteobacteria bacterium]